MPYYLHQFKYKDEHIRDMLQERQDPDREQIIRSATQVFGGKLHGFYFAFGEFDGIAITEFADEKHAMACAMTIFGQGRVYTLRTTPLFPMNEALDAIHIAQVELGAAAPQPVRP